MVSMLQLSLLLFTYLMKDWWNRWLVPGVLSCWIGFEWVPGYAEWYFVIK